MKQLLAVFVLFMLSGCFAIEERSSHSEAPGTAAIPNADITDVYAFRSYETGRQPYIVFLINSIPLQNPNAGPNYYTPSDKHFFEINIDNTGDCVEDIIIQIYNGNELGGNITNITRPDDDPCGNGSTIGLQAHEGLLIPVGNPGGPNQLIATALKFIGEVSSFDDTDLNWREYYYVNFINGSRDGGTPTPLTMDGNPKFPKPFDYAGQNSFPSYATYAGTFINTFDDSVVCDLSGESLGRVFVGQRKESFSIALGKIFDLIDFIPVELDFLAAGVGIAQCAAFNELSGKNVLTYAVEIHEDCIKNPDPNVTIIGVWATVRELKHIGSQHIAGKQVSRLGNPLVNELFIGLNDKAKFSIGHPLGDGANFLDYVRFPTLPEIVDILFLGPVNTVLGTSLPTLAPTVPRADLVTAFLTGVPGLNQFPVFEACEYLRLNLAIPAVARADQEPLGVLANDTAGFPNGRRPGDDVVDIALRVVMGALCAGGQLGCNTTDAPVFNVPFTDGAPIAATDFGTAFPFLNLPNPGSVPYTDPTVCPGAGGSTGTGTGTGTGAGTSSGGGDGCASSASVMSSWLSFF